MTTEATQLPEWQILLQRKQELLQPVTDYPAKHSIVVTEPQANLYHRLGSSEWLRQRLDDIGQDMPEHIYNDPANHKTTFNKGRPKGQELERDTKGRLLPPKHSDTPKTHIAIALSQVQYNIYRTINGHNWLRQELEHRLRQDTPAIPEQPATPTPTVAITKEWLQAQLAAFDN